MEHFIYKDKVLHAEDVNVMDIIASVGSPCYIYSTRTLLRHFRLFDEALANHPHLVCFAVKALSNVAVLRCLAQAGAGMDVVSGGEYRRAKAAGVCGDKIVFSGVGKTDEEMQLALEGGVRQFNIESEPELERLNAIACKLNTRAPIALRVNPDVDAKTHAKISTGKSENKFGIPLSKARSVYANAAKMDGIEVVGIDVHIGSQLTDLAPFEEAYTKLANFTKDLRDDGHDIKRLDLGGGLGIPYKRSNEAPPLPSEYGAMVQRVFADLNCELVIEPGRLIAGNAGLLISQVIYRKEGEGRSFLIVDAAMNDLVRPAMYEAHHDIIPVQEPPVGQEFTPVDIVGPVCETGDTFAKQRNLPPLQRGDLIAFRSAGAYGAVMASEYNSRPLIPEVLVHEDQFAVIRERPTYEQMLEKDIMPKWLQGAHEDPAQ